MKKCNLKDIDIKEISNEFNLISTDLLNKNKALTDLTPNQLANFSFGLVGVLYAFKKIKQLKDKDEFQK